MLRLKMIFACFLLLIFAPFKPKEVKQYFDDHFEMNENRAKEKVLNTFKGIEK